MAKLPRFNANQLVSKAVKIADEVSGYSARKYENAASVLRSANSMGLKGSRRVGKPAIERMERLAQAHRGRSTQTRVKAGIGASAGVAGGFLGLHKYHQHRDEKIMDRINTMYLKKR
jgi:hypothetical protein